MFPRTFLAVAAASVVLVHGHKGQQDVNPQSDLITTEVRHHWMRVAIQALYDLVSPCPFSAYGTAIINHTAGGHGELVCIGANSIAEDGNPTSHGEIAALNNCSAILTDPNGAYGLSPEEAMEAYKQLSLYTTAEACPMCATAIRWAGFKEYIYATSSETLVEAGWRQIDITSRELFERTSALEPNTVLIADVLNEETDPLLVWQFDTSVACPNGCSRDVSTQICAPGINQDGRDVHGEL